MRERLLLEILEEVADQGSIREEILESHEVADRETGLQLAEERLATLAGQKVRARLHYHRHDAHGNNCPCMVESIAP